VLPREVTGPALASCLALLALSFAVDVVLLLHKPSRRT